MKRNLILGTFSKCGTAIVAYVTDPFSFRFSENLRNPINRIVQWYTYLIIDAFVLQIEVSFQNHLDLPTAMTLFFGLDSRQITCSRQNRWKTRQKHFFISFFNFRYTISRFFQGNFQHFGFWQMNFILKICQTVFGKGQLISASTSFALIYSVFFLSKGLSLKYFFWWQSFNHNTTWH